MKLYHFAFKLCVLALALLYPGAARVLDTVQWAALEDVSASGTISTSSTLTTSLLTDPTPGPQDARAICSSSSCDFDPDGNECAPRGPNDDFDDPYLDDPDNPNSGDGDPPIGISDANNRPFEVPGERDTLPGANGRKISLKARPYPGATTICDVLEENGAEDCQAFRMRTQICQETQLETFSHKKLQYDEKKNKYSTEHVIELQFVRMLVVAAISGTLPTQTRLVTAAIPFDSFYNCFNQDNCVPSYIPPGSSEEFTKPADILFEIIGSKTNLPGFFLLERALNNRKSKCFSLDSPVDQKKFDTYVDDAISRGKSEDRFLQPIRETIGAWQYMNNENVANVISEKRTFLLNGISYISRNANDPDLGRLEDIFREMDQDLWETAALQCQTLIANRIETAREKFNQYIAITGGAPQNWDRVKQALDTLESNLSAFVAPKAPYPPK
ncbi:pectate lyase superfamily protein-domain-containing protein [Apiospora arundinis]